MSAAGRQCGNMCGKPASSQCGGCGSAVYCGSECQRVAWPHHKLRCRSLAAQKAGGSRAPIAPGVRVRVLQMPPFTGEEGVVVEAASMGGHTAVHLDSGTNLHVPAAWLAPAAVVELPTGACAHCAAESASLSRCGGCAMVTYCTEECQSSAWSGHQGECTRAAWARVDRALGGEPDLAGAEVPLRLALEAAREQLKEKTDELLLFAVTGGSGSVGPPPPFVGLPQWPRALSATVAMFVCALQLARLYTLLTRFHEAVPLYAEALEGLRKVAGPSSLRTLSAASGLAAALQQLDKPGEAEMPAREAMEGLSSALGAAHPDTVAAARVLAKLLVSLGKVGEARDLLRRLPTL